MQTEFIQENVKNILLFSIQPFIVVMTEEIMFDYPLICPSTCWNKFLEKKKVKWQVKCFLYFWLELLLAKKFPL